MRAALPGMLYASKHLILLVRISRLATQKIPLWGRKSHLSLCCYRNLKSLCLPRLPTARLDIGWHAGCLQFGTVTATRRASGAAGAVGNS